MIILYVPFHEENDLITKAKNWKEARKDQNILILQHGDPISYKLMKQEHLTIYILAHGVDHFLEQLQLTSNYPINGQTSCLGIDKIAERFNSDFVYLHSKVRHIKLYFCNNQGNQRPIAEQFHKNLVLFDAPINYYAGTLFSPSQNKKKYSYYHNQWHSCSKVRNTLYQETYLEADEKMDIKRLTMRRFFSDAKQKRIDLFMQTRKKAYHELLMHMRKTKRDPEEPINGEIITKGKPLFLVV